MTDVLPTSADVSAAAARLRQWVVRTPVLESPLLNERLGTRVLLKAECLQYTGSFKIRGAMNRLLQLSADERAAGVVAFSSGNHAQGVAQAARWLGCQAVIVMPRDAPAVKLQGTRDLGAEVVLYDRYAEDREAIARQIAARRGAALVPAFDHADVIAGQGTVGLELVEWAREHDLSLGQVLVPCGGGGLCAGISLAVRSRFPDARILGVEPVGFDDTRQSLKAERRLSVRNGAGTLCDSLMTLMPGAITFAVNRRLMSQVLLVDDDQVARAMQFAFRHLQLVLEPGGAAALAALLAGKLEPLADCVAVVLSGGNVEPALFSRLIKGGLAAV
jgi:threonine dehydratase